MSLAGFLSTLLCGVCCHQRGPWEEVFKSSKGAHVGNSSSLSVITVLQGL